MSTEKKYRLGKTLGSGTFGLVKVATHISTGNQFAVKILEKSRIKNQADIDRIKREIRILKLLNHPNIIKLHDLVETQKVIFLVMDYCEGGELFELINKSEKIDESAAKKIYSQIIDAIEYLATIRVAHRDLKPENILFDKEMNLKIVDFGLSNTWKSGERLQTACGTPCYAAPEMISSKMYKGTLTDIWSSGVLLYFMVCGHLPFEDHDTDSLYKKILNCNSMISSILPSYLSENLKDLLTKILNTNPRKRIGIRQIRNHPWFTNTLKRESLPRISVDKLTQKLDFKIDIKVVEDDETYTPKIQLNNSCQPKKNIKNSKNLDITEENANKSIQNSSKRIEEIFDFSTIQIQNNLNEVQTKPSIMKRRINPRKSNNSSLAVPRSPSQKTESSKSRLPQITVIGQRSSIVPLSPVPAKSIALAVSNASTIASPKLSHITLNFYPENNKMMRKNLKKFEIGSNMRRSRQRKHKFKYSHIQSPSNIELKTVKNVPQYPSQCYERKRIRSRCANNYELDVIESIQDEKLTEYNPNSSFINTKYSGFKLSNVNILNSPVSRPNKIAKTKNACKRVSSIGFEENKVLNLSLNESIQEKYLRNNANFLTLYNYEKSGLNCSFGTHCCSPLYLVPPGYLIPQNSIYE